MNDIRLRRAVWEKKNTERLFTLHKYKKIKFWDKCNENLVFVCCFTKIVQQSNQTKTYRKYLRGRILLPSGLILLHIDFVNKFPKAWDQVS